MEFGGREIMILVGILVLVAIVLVVVRRVRRSRYEKIRMPRRKQPIFDDDVELDEYGSELPSGGARVVGRRDDSDVQALSQSLKQIAESSKPKLSIFEQSQSTPSGTVDAVDASRPERIEPQIAVESAPEPEDMQAPPAEAAAESAPETPPEKDQSPVEGGVVVFNVMAEKGAPFTGNRLLMALQENGMRYGDMNIFHRHNTDGEVLFSLANSVNPGTFKLETINQFQSPGVSLFFAMDTLSDPVEAFETMLTTAHELAQRLGGQLCDERRDRMSTATLTALRDRVEDFANSRPARAH